MRIDTPLEEVQGLDHRITEEIFPTEMKLLNRE